MTEQQMVKEIAQRVLSLAKQHGMKKVIKAVKQAVFNEALVEAHGNISEVSRRIKTERSTIVKHVEVKRVI